MSDFFKQRSWIPELNPFLSNNDMHSCKMSIDMKAQIKLPHTLLDIGKSGHGDDFKSSFNKKPNSKELEEYIKPTKNMSDDFLAADFKFGLINGTSIGGFFKGDSVSFFNARKYSEIFVDRLMTGKGETWHDDGVLSAGMGHTPEVKSFTKKVCTDLKSLMLINFGDFWNIKLNKNNYKNISFSFESSPTLKGLVGGTQKTIVSIKNINYKTIYRTWKASLVLQIEDDFGVEESDVTNPRGGSAKLAKPALADFWVLQHQRGKKPFKTIFKIPFSCNGYF